MMTEAHRALNRLKRILNDQRYGLTEPTMKHLLLPLLFLYLTSCGKNTDRSKVFETVAGTDLDGMRAATLELRPEGQYYFTMELIGQTITGTYEQKDGKLLLKPTNGLLSMGTWSGDTLQVNGLTMLQSKR